MATFEALPMTFSPGDRTICTPSTTMAQAKPASEPGWIDASTESAGTISR